MKIKKGLTVTTLEVTDVKRQCSERQKPECSGLRGKEEPLTSESILITWQGNYQVTSADCLRYCLEHLGLSF